MTCPKNELYRLLGGKVKYEVAGFNHVNGTWIMRVIADGLDSTGEAKTKKDAAANAARKAIGVINQRLEQERAKERKKQEDAAEEAAKATAAASESAQLEAEIGCQRKRRYATAEFAGKIASASKRKENDLRLRVYLCHFCGGYHLTKAPLSKVAERISAKP